MNLTVKKITLRQNSFPAKLTRSSLSAEYLFIVITLQKRHYMLSFSAMFLFGCNVLIRPILVLTLFRLFLPCLSIVLVRFFSYSLGYSSFSLVRLQNSVLLPCVPFLQSPANIHLTRQYNPKQTRK